MQDIHDIKDPLALTFDYLPYIIFFTVLFLLLLLFIYLSLKKKKPAPPPETPAPAEIKLSPREIALLELEKVKKEQLIELNKTDIFYNRLTGILKRYIEDQYKLEADSRTSTEIILQLKSLKLNYDFVRQAELCLKDLDFAKYSFYKKSARDMSESFDLAYSLFKLEDKLYHESEITP
jgi:hypothetical protein